MKKTDMKYAENWLKMSRGPLLSKVLAMCLHLAPIAILMTCNENSDGIKNMTMF